jgi:hypothetical protein
MIVEIQIQNSIKFLITILQYSILKIKLGFLRCKARILQ